MSDRRGPRHLGRPAPSIELDPALPLEIAKRGKRRASEYRERKQALHRHRLAQLMCSQPADRHRSSSPTTLR